MSIGNVTKQRDAAEDGIECWNGVWTPELVKALVTMKRQGYPVNDITDVLFERYNGPSNHDTVARKHMDLFPGEPILGYTGR